MNDSKGPYAIRISSNGKPSTVVDFVAYTEYVTGLEGKIDADKLNVEMLDSMLEMAVSAGDLIDLYKKVLVYGRTDLKDRLLRASVQLRRASAQLDDSIFLDGDTGRRLPIGNKGQINLRLLHAALGGFGEWAEILNAVRKTIYTGTLDAVNVIEELGDAGYYDAAAHDSISVAKHVSMGLNKAKLDVRFGGSGTFFEKVNNRNLDAERVALEGGHALAVDSTALHTMEGEGGVTDLPASQYGLVGGGGCEVPSVSPLTVDPNPTVIN